MANTKVTTGVIADDAITSAKIDSTSTGMTFADLTVTGEITANGGIALGDSDKATFGASDDLQIYHTGLHSTIQEVGTGNLYIDSSTLIQLRSGDAGETYAVFNDDGAVTLYYDNSPKFATTSTGINVTGTVTSDGLTVDGTTSNPVTINSSVNGSQLKFDDGTVSTQPWNVGIKNDGTNDFLIYNLGSENIELYTADKLRQKIGSGGDVSFYEDTGTTAKLFWDASAESLTLRNGGSEGILNVGGSTSSIVARFTDAITSSVVMRPETGGAIIGSDGGGALHLAANGSTLSDRKITILPAGNVGIGTTNPQYKLSLNDASTSAYPLVLENGNIGTAGVHTGIRFGYSGNTYQKGAIIFEGQDSSGRGKMYFAMEGTADSSNADETDAKLTIDYTGNVGIGTSSPSAPLHVKSGANNNNSIITIEGATNNIFELGYATQGAFLNSAAGDPMVFRINETERMRIDSSGNLLVGRTSNFSGAKAEIQTSDNVTTLTLNKNNANDGEILRIAKSGTTVGSIGTVSGYTKIVGGDGTNGSGLVFSDAKLYPVNAAGSISDNSIDIGVSTHRFKDLYLSGGVYVGGTGAANYLDDYEEGTWTPTLKPLSGSMSATITSEAHYVKIGQLVFVHFYCDITAIASQTAANDYPVITNLPFGGSSSNSYLDSGVVSRNEGFNGTPNISKCVMGGGAIFFAVQSSNVSFPPHAANPPYTTGSISGSLVYWTTS